MRLIWLAPLVLTVLEAGQGYLSNKQLVYTIPRFAVERQAWVCLDRDPRQLGREDCGPQRK